jgi:hypothetical protein
MYAVRRRLERPCENGNVVARRRTQDFGSLRL